MILVQPDVVGFPREIRGILLERSQFITKSAIQNPSHMGPPLAVTWRGWISPLICISVMHAVNRNPEDGPVLEGKRAAGGKAILQPLWSGAATVSQQAVVTDPDADVLRQDPYDWKHRKSRPPKTKQSGQRAQMKAGKGDRKDPVDATSYHLSVKRCHAAQSICRRLRVFPTTWRLNVHHAGSQPFLKKGFPK